MNTETAPICVQEGFNVLIAGSSVYNPKFSVKAGIEALKKAIVDIA